MLSPKSSKFIQRLLGKFRDVRLKNLLEECGAYLETAKTGQHYLLSSKLHTNVFYDMGRALQYRDLCELFALIMLYLLEEQRLIQSVNVIMGPERGAIPLLHTIKQYLPARNVRTLVIERGETGYQLPAHAIIDPSDCILCVDDVFTTGKTLRAAIELCNTQSHEEHGGMDTMTVALSVCVNRAPKMWHPQYFMPVIPMVWIIRDPQEAYTADECSKDHWCKKDIPLVKK